MPVVAALAYEDPSRWDVVELRRLRAGDPAADAAADRVRVGGAAAATGS